MKPLEVLIFIILLLMGVPDLCRLLRRPALVYPVYFVVGMLLGGLFSPSTEGLILQVGQFGFILLLFLIGLEIDLPKRNESLVALRRAGLWIALQFPLLVLIGWLLKGTIAQSALTASALCGCSVGMAFFAWKEFPHRDEETGRGILLWMVGLEILSIFLITGADIAVEQGFSWWGLLHLLGTAIAFVLVALTADHITRGLSRLLDFTTRWRVHFIVLLIFTVAAVGERLGLSAPKTAFCLGLFVSRATHQGLQLEDHLRPIGEKLLIPVFFVSLGALLPPLAFFSWTGLWALLSAVFLLGLREVLYRRAWKRGLPGGGRSFLLVCPNLTLAGVAAETLRETGTSGELLKWLLMTSLLMTVAAIMLLPAGEKPAAPPPEEEEEPSIFAIRSFWHRRHLPPPPTPLP
ncbi:MAG: cation:proton antiporter [Verrucomicrobium sp.]|nr:cation:proton antiporter [Verrucomicrobium sp.]